ncbi:MAG: fibronectin type III domain-containing protein [Limisphaerales bacterium]
MPLASHRADDNPALPLLLFLFLALGALAHSGHLASVHDTVAAVALRLKAQLPEAELRNLTATTAEGVLTLAEREVLGAHHLTFRMNAPAVVTVFHEAPPDSAPFWLAERGFQPTGEVLDAAGKSFAGRARAFPPGEVGLGVNSLQGGGEHYFVALRPVNPADSLAVTDLYPGQLRLGELCAGAQPWADRDAAFTNVPPALAGQILLRTERARRNDAQLVNIFRWTPHPANARPDQLVLTWSGDPKTTQAIQWRTDTTVTRGRVAWAKKADYLRPRPARLREVRAGAPERLEDRWLVNQPSVHRFTAELTGLEPGTTYLYSVGDGSRDGWTELAEFTTAPAGVAPFSFVYLGDAQNGLDRWGTLLRNCFRHRPDAAFYLMAGDLVDRGNQRDDWDSFFHNAAGIFDRRQLVPVLGNHENQGGHPTLYLRQFRLMTNGPAGLEPERAYSFEYGNALFVVLDSNLPPAGQSEWLEAQLAGSRATWKFVTYHHPAYSSAPNRDNLALRNAWTPLFDKHQVDLALQGHDHAYLRTYPLRANQRVASPKDGTVYVVSVSGTKMYPQDPRDYTEFGMTNVATYQVLDLQISGHRLVYRAYDTEGVLRDQLVVEK